jgi:hypothetical protein
MYYQHFPGRRRPGLAARVSDAAAVTAKYEIPTMQASECVVCHKTIDPVAGCFRTTGVRKASTAAQGRLVHRHVRAGFEGEDLPDDERWRALQWLGERTAKDPRFATAMVEHVYYILTGRRPLLPPKELDDPLYPARRRAYRSSAARSKRSRPALPRELQPQGQCFKDWAVSDFYRADGLATAVNRSRAAGRTGRHRPRADARPSSSSGRCGGLRRAVGPAERPLAMLYGGIDSEEVTERATDPSGAMGAIQRMLANDVACKNTLRDFARRPAERRLFPGIEPDVMPGASAEADAAIRRAIVHLHEVGAGPIRRRIRPKSIARSAVRRHRGRRPPAKGLDKREIYSLPPRRSRRARRSALHDPRLARRGDVPAAPAEFLYE